MSDQPSHLVRLNPHQFDAVTSLEGPLLILAGAGSGKTRVLTRRIAHLLYNQVDPENILAVTFTNKAATEMKERVEELVGSVARKVWVSTFHAACVRILRQDIEPLGYTRRFAIYDDDDQVRIIRTLLKDMGYDLETVTPKSVLSRIDWYKNRMKTPDELLAQLRAHANDPLIRVWREYERQLRTADALDFNDLIGTTVRLFTEHPEVLRRWQDKFHYILVDEYQDTNNAQYRLLRMLAIARGNLAVVGDDDQSIYGFRGADISNILGFERDFPGAKVIRMEQNYRCTGNILEVANAVVARNSGRIAKQLWTEAQGGPKVQLIVSKDPDDEARRVARYALQLRRHGHPWSDIAILYRTNITSQPFELALRAARVPHKVIGGPRFYARREVRDVVSYLRLVANPADDAAFLRIVNVPPRGVGLVSLAKIREEASNRGEPLLKTARSFAHGDGKRATGLKTLIELIDDAAAAATHHPIAEVLRRIVAGSGYVEMLEQEDAKKAPERKESLQQLLRDASRFVPEEEVHGMPRLQAWLDSAALTGGEEEVPSAEGEVTLMTVHNSKGLEYPVVFVVQMVEGQFPHARSAVEGVDEERRLAYVAFTRAQKRLIISRSQGRRSSPDPRSTVELVPPSPFLFGLPTHVCEGDMPMGVDEAPAGPDTTAQLRTFLQGGRPKAPVKTVPLTSFDQLVENVKVQHPVYGVGTVHRRFGAGSEAKVRIFFGDQRPRTLSLRGETLSLVVEE